MLSIQPSDRVLEVGSGNRPRKRSNVLCDKFPEDAYHRGGEAPLVLDGRPFVAADGLVLPFKDRSFNYVIASHVLEHVQDPFAFAAELMRVAPAGYIETPSELGEMVFGWQFHRWKVRLDQDTLVLRPRRMESPFGTYFHDAYARDLHFAEFVDSHVPDFYVQYEWHGRINLRVEEDTVASVKFNSESPLGTVRPEWKHGPIALTRTACVPLLRLLRHFRRGY